MSDFFDVHIQFRDGTEETFTYASILDISDGALHLYVVNNTYTREREHMGSWPMGTIKKWTRKNR